MELNKSIEVNEEQYKFFRKELKSVIAHRQENGKYFIKRLWPSFSKECDEALKYSSKL